jgi:hypothetical protein
LAIVELKLIESQESSCVAVGKIIIQSDFYMSNEVETVIFTNRLRYLLGVYSPIFLADSVLF